MSFRIGFARESGSNTGRDSVLGGSLPGGIQVFLTRRHFVAASLAATTGLSGLSSRATSAQPILPSGGALPYRAHAVRTPDGLNIAIQDWGDPTKPAILFIHGFLSGSICWMRQFESPLAEHFRLVAYDWRGHGSSDKPNDTRLYAHGPQWADEIDAVVGTLGLRRPLLVGWSMAGEIIGDYLAHRGDASISGVNFVDAGALNFPSSAAESEERAQAAQALTSVDTAASVAATEAFIRMCTAVPLGPRDLALWTAVANRVPWFVRRSLTSRPQNDLQSLLRGLRVPAMVTHGGRDTVAGIAGSRRAAKLIPDATLAIYEDAGHASFWDAAGRYNQDLYAFAKRAFDRS